MIIFYSISSNHHKSTSSIISPRIILPLLIGIASAKGFSSHFAQRTFIPTRNHLRLPLIPPALATTITNSDMPKPKYSWTKPTLDLALPALVASIVDPLVSMLDTACIGRLGKDALGALGVCTSIFYISFYGFLATKTASTTLVASASSKEEAKLVTLTSLQLGVAAGCLVLLILRMFGPQCLGAMGIDASSNIYPHALKYLSTRCLSAPFFLLITISEGALRGYGDTKIPLLASMATASSMAALEPLLMFVLGWHIRGSAAAMGLSQVVGALVYAHFLRKRFDGKKSQDEGKNTDNKVLTKGKILATIARANASMILKQGSLLFTWAYATKSAAKFGSEHVAAHQVALSFWMLFAYILDSLSVGAQILLSKARTRKSLDEVRSVTKYMTSVATIQGLVITLIIAGLTPHVPSFFTKDAAVIAQLKTLLPIISIQQILISLTFVMEALAAGGGQFALLGIGTAVSAFAAITLMSSASSVLEIWNGGILAMFLGRFAAATLGVLNVNALLPRFKFNNEEDRFR
jgi:putative MATE family efflux protein